MKKRRMKPIAFIKKYGRIMIGGAIILAVLIMGIFAPLMVQWFTPLPADYDPNLTFAYEKLKAPGVDGYIWGTDQWGRDIFAQVCYGARVAVGIPVGVQIMTIIIGTIVGLICGYYPKADAVLSRLMEAINAIPMFVMALLFCEIFGRGIFSFIMALSLSGFIGVARLIRGRVLSIRKEEYIECEKVMGASDLRTLFHHVLPACSNTLLVRFSTGLSGTLLSMVGLAFMSVGLSTSIPNWGVSVNLGRVMFLLQPHQVMIPAAFIVVTTFGFSMLGDGMRNVIGSGRSN